MSSGQRHTLEQATAALDQLATWLGVRVATQPTQGAVFAVGSLRRRSATVGDLELLAPLPAGYDDDPLWAALAALFRERHVELWDAPGTVGRQLMGVRPGFAHCRVELATGSGPLPVEVFRYRPGPDGNMGWLALMKSGPVRFVRHALVQRGRIIQRQASVDAYPTDDDGRPIACPCERQALELCGMPWVPPELRGDWFDRMIDGRLRRAAPIGKPRQKWRWKG